MSDETPIEPTEPTGAVAPLAPSEPVAPNAAIDAAPAPAAAPGVAPALDAAPRPRRIGALPIIAAVLAVLLLGAGVAVVVLGSSARDDADHELIRERRRLVEARTVLRRARADLAAARASGASFGASAQGATAATARVVELEGTLVDLLARLRAAGEAEQIGTYNQLVDQLNGTSDDLVRAYTDLELPLRDFSDAIDTLPTARCAAPIAATITWSKYGKEGLQCARLQVPLDYSVPEGRKIQITVVRRPADGGPDSLGPLVLNPGGPGVSGVAFMRDAQVLLPPELLRRFDLVTFDPRGVGHSSAVDCADKLDPLFDAELTGPHPDAAVTSIQQIVAGCRARSGPLLDHVDTVSVAKDMDRLRAALSVNQLSYIGFSYGTYLGAVYADLYPERVRAAVLDGAVDPSRATESETGDDSESFRTALDAALDSCASQPSCAFYSGGDPQGAYDRLMSRLVAQPLDVAGHRVGRNLAEVGVVSALYFGETGWPRLMNALARANVGDGRPLSDLADSYTGRRRDGTYNNEIEAHYAVNCTDLAGRLPPKVARDKARHLGSDPGRFESIGLAFELPCTYWPAPAHPAPGPLDARGAAPILVIGGAADPATPIEGATALATRLDSGVLLRSEDSGHTSFARGNTCVDNYVVAYLVSLTPPPVNTSCPAG